MLARSRPQLHCRPIALGSTERNEHGTLGPNLGYGVTGDEHGDVARCRGEDDAELFAERSICAEFLTALEQTRSVSCSAARRTTSDACSVDVKAAARAGTPSLEYVLLQEPRGARGNPSADTSATRMSSRGGARSGPEGPRAPAAHPQHPVPRWYDE